MTKHPYSAHCKVTSNKEEQALFGVKQQMSSNIQTRAAHWMFLLKPYVTVLQPTLKLHYLFLFLAQKAVNMLT